MLTVWMVVSEALLLEADLWSSAAQYCYWRVRVETTPEQQQRKQNPSKGLRPTKDAWISSRRGLVFYGHIESEAEQSASKNRAQVLLSSF